MKTLLAIILLHLIALIGTSQCTLQLTLRITDLNQQLPLAFVVAELHADESSDQASLQASLTDSSGIIIWKDLCAGKYHIKLHRVGLDDYSTSIALTSSQVLEIQAAPNSMMLQHIMVQTNRGFRDSDIAQAISDEDVQNQRGKTLAEMLSHATGVRIQRTGNNITKPMIQGLQGNRLLFYYQGVRHESQQWGSEHAPEIDPFSATKFIVYKGPSALRFGHDAIGGLVKIENEDIPMTIGVQQRWQMSSASNGKMGAVSGSISWRPKRLSSFGLRMQGTAQRCGNYQTPELYLDNTSARNRHFSALAQFDKNSIHSEIFYSLYAGDIGIFAGSHIGNITDLENVLQGDSIRTSNTFSYAIERPKQHMVHELVKWNLSGKTSAFSSWIIQLARQYNLRDEYDRFGALNDSIAALNLPELHMEITTHSGFAAYSYKKDNWSMEVKTDAMRQENTTSGRVFIPNFLQSELGGYACLLHRKKRNEWMFSARYDWRTTTSFFYTQERLETPTHDFKGWSGALARHQHVGKNTQITWNVGHSWRAPHPNELYANGLHHGTATIEYGNANLQPERAWSTQSQLISQNDSWNVQVEGYFKYIRNFINLTPTGQYTATIRGVFPTFKFQPEDIRMRGIDAKLIYHVHEHLQIGTECSLVRAIHAETNDWIYRMPADQYRCLVMTNIHRHPDGAPTFIQLYYTYVNQQWRIPQNGEYVAPPKAYSLLQLRLRRSFQWEKYTLDLSMSVDNILNQKYRDYLDAMRYYTDAAGRSVSLNLDLHF
ncbi:MAG: TonB-dependent receptor [Flavobacteriales bacterium]